jgi:hypothetical protein
VLPKDKAAWSYARLLHWCLDHRIPVLAAFGAFVVVSLSRRCSSEGPYATAVPPNSLVPPNNLG